MFTLEEKITAALIEAALIERETTMSPVNAATTFPFKLDDLLYWVIRRKDGTLLKFVFQDPAKVLYEAKTGTSMVPVKSGNSSPVHHYPSLKQWCEHTPKVDRPLFESKNGKVKLYVADAWGIREACDQFDLVLDCGDVLTPRVLGLTNPIIGDPGLVGALKKYSTAPAPASASKAPKKLLQLHWLDRQAPYVGMEFWPELSKRLMGKVATNCQGGHGRSGTAFVCLLMTMAPDYNAADAIIHLRACHCPRAIESNVQHEYIDQFAKFLGRKANAAEAKTITSYKDAFDKLDKPTAVRTRKMIADFKPVAATAKEGVRCY